MGSGLSCLSGEEKESLPNAKFPCLCPFLDSHQNLGTSLLLSSLAVLSGKQFRVNLPCRGGKGPLFLLASATEVQPCDSPLSLCKYPPSFLRLWGCVTSEARGTPWAVTPSVGRVVLLLLCLPSPLPCAPAAAMEGGGGAGHAGTPPALPSLHTAF